jgi:hypothetical protein
MASKAYPKQITSQDALKQVRRHPLRVKGIRACGSVGKRIVTTQLADEDKQMTWSGRRTMRPHTWKTAWNL